MTIDTVNGKVMFNGVVSFQSLTDVPQMVAENTNINITDNLIPTDGWNVDTHADYIWVGDPEYSMAVGAGDFLEAQLVLDANDEVYSPYLEDMTAGTNNWSIYSAGGDASFAGYVIVNKDNIKERWIETF